MFGNQYTWGNINVYYLSYLRNQRKRDYNMNHLYFMVPVGIFVGNIVPIVSAWLNRYVHVKILLLFSLLCVIGCHIMLYYFDSIFWIISAMVIHGIGTGFMHYQAIKNCWEFFPKKRGLVSGIYNCSFGASSFILTLFADYVINPNNISAEHEIFPSEVSKNVPKFIYKIILIFSILTVISVLLIFEKKKDTQEEKVEKETISQVLKNPRIYVICFVVFTLNFYGLLVTNTNRGFGNSMQIDIKILKILSPIYAAINGFGRIFWGSMYDFFGFFPLYMIICPLQFICSASLYFSGKNGIAYLIVSLLSVVSFSGETVLFPPIISHSFGIKNSAFLIGIVSYFIAFAAVLGPILSSLILREGHVKDYLKLYLIGTAFTVIGFILVFFINEKPFNYKDLNETLKADSLGSPLDGSQALMKEETEK